MSIFEYISYENELQKEVAKNSQNNNKINDQVNSYNSVDLKNETK